MNSKQFSVPVQHVSTREQEILDLAEAFYRYAQEEIMYSGEPYENGGKAVLFLNINLQMAIDHFKQEDGNLLVGEAVMVPPTQEEVQAAGDHLYDELAAQQKGIMGWLRSPKEETKSDGA